MNISLKICRKNTQERGYREGKGTWRVLVAIETAGSHPFYARTYRTSSPCLGSSYQRSLQKANVGVTKDAHAKCRMASDGTLMDCPAIGYYAKRTFTINTKLSPNWCKISVSRDWYVLHISPAQSHNDWFLIIIAKLYIFHMLLTRNLEIVQQISWIFHMPISRFYVISVAINVSNWL